MIAKGTTAQVIEAAATAAGVRADVRDVRPTRDGGQRVRFGLRLGCCRRADGSRRHSGAVCWHGHRDFFRALFAAAPGARVQTMQTERTVPGGWYTAGNFEDVYQNTGDANVGSAYDPISYADACDCDSDQDDVLKTARITTMRYVDIKRCPFAIMLPSHYRADGTCKCNDADERAHMMRDWGYTADDFARKGGTS